MLGNRNTGNCCQMKLSIGKPDEALGIEEFLENCCSLVLYNPEFCDYQKECLTANLNVLYVGDDCVKFEKSYANKSGFCILFSPKMLPHNILEKLAPFVEFGYYDVDFEMESQLRNYFSRISAEALSEYLYRKEAAVNLLFELSHYIIRNIILPEYYNKISN